MATLEQQQQDLFLKLPHRLETARLDLRWPQVGDGPEFNAALLESLAELRLWFSWAMEMQTVEESEDFMQYAADGFAAGEELTWLLFLRQKPTLIGLISFHIIDWSVPKMMMSYWLRTPYARQGYMTEAAQKLVDFTFETFNLCRLEIWCDSRNERSAALARRLGFDHEGILRCDNRDHLTNALIDQMIFAKVVRR
jgi:RimJ/RimL family protein N-acetyltransferase